MTAPFVRLEDAMCVRGGSLVFQGVDVAVFPRDFLLVLGENGSGKTSLLRALAGLLDCSVDRQVSCPSPPLFIPSHVVFTSNFTVREWLDMQFGMLPPSLRQNSVSSAMEIFALSPLSAYTLLRLSEGQKKRLLLCRLLFQKASLWILDEPTEYLDCRGHDSLLQVLHAHRESEGAVVLATHHPQMFASVRGVRSLRLERAQ